MLFNRCLKTDACMTFTRQSQEGEIGLHCLRTKRRFCHVQYIYLMLTLYQQHPLHILNVDNCRRKKMITWREKITEKRFSLLTIVQYCQEGPIYSLHHQPRNLFRCEDASNSLNLLRLITSSRKITPCVRLDPMFKVKREMKLQYCTDYPIKSRTTDSDCLPFSLYLFTSTV